jgi:peptidyl-prolyl cis-trans isomerase D
VSAPIKGKRGVYVVKVSDFKEDNLLTAESVQADLARSTQSRVDFETFNALKESANIEDNRAKFY